MDYEASLLESLTTITSRSKTLMARAVKTHIRDFARCMSPDKIPLSHRRRTTIKIPMQHSEFTN
jgi:hypothetical protein